MLYRTIGVLTVGNRTVAFKKVPFHAREDIFEFQLPFIEPF